MSIIWRLQAGRLSFPRSCSLATGFILKGPFLRMHHDFDLLSRFLTPSEPALSHFSQHVLMLAVGSLARAQPGSWTRMPLSSVPTSKCYRPAFLQPERPLQPPQRTSPSKLCAELSRFFSGPKEECWCGDGQKAASAGDTPPPTAVHTWFRCMKGTSPPPSCVCVCVRAGKQTTKKVAASWPEGECSKRPA